MVPITPAPAPTVSFSQPVVQPAAQPIVTPSIQPKLAAAIAQPVVQPVPPPATTTVVMQPTGIPVEEVRIDRDERRLNDSGVLVDQQVGGIT